MNEPSTSSNSGTKEEDNPLPPETQRVLMKLVQNAERQRLEELREIRAEQARYLEQAILDREEEIRRMNLEHNLPRPLRARNGGDRCNSEDSGYGSVRHKRPKSKSEQIWDRMVQREQRIQAEKEKKKQEEDKQELDAMFHILLHGSNDLLLSDPSEYEYKLPAFMKFDEIQRGFDEQMRKEKKEREEREERERRRAAGIEEPKVKKEKKPTQTEYIYNQWGHGFVGYDNPSIKTATTTDSKAHIKKERKRPIDPNEIIEVLASSDEEDTAHKRAIKWTNRHSSTNSIAGTSSCACTTTSRSTGVITVHDSDSD